MGSETTQEVNPKSPRRLLVVEDERIVARDLCGTLEEMGYVVGGTARTAKEALAHVAAQRFDLVLMDIRIKGQTDGIAAAIELKHRCDLPVVFLTANTDQGTLERVFRTMPDGYLSKPFTRSTLGTAVELALQRHAVESHLRQTNGLLETQKSELEQRTGDLGLLSELGDVLQLCDSVDEVAAIVQRFGRKIFPEDDGALYLFDGAGTDLAVTASWGRGEPTPTFDLAGCRALRSGEPHRVLPPHDHLRCAHIPGEVASICAPMAVNGTAYGVLSLTVPVVPGFEQSMMEKKEQLARVASQRISLTLTNLRIRAQLKRDAIVDPLTGLFNRRYMASALDRELRLAARNNRQVSVIIFDIDHFKVLNDQFGHAAADRALCEVAELLRFRLRSYDVATRYGGDEMVLILPDTTIEGAFALGDDLRQSIRGLVIKYGGFVLPPISISVGVAAHPANGDDSDSLLRAADLALYQAKARGRNCVVLAAEGVRAEAANQDTLPDLLNPDLSRTKTPLASV